MLLEHERDYGLGMDSPGYRMLLELQWDYGLGMDSATMCKGGGCCHDCGMDAQRKTPCLVSAVILRPRKSPKCSSCHAGQSRLAQARTHFLCVNN